MMTLIALLLLPLAHAGKLGDGWRGHPYGDAAWLAKAPGDRCVAAPEPGFAWTCTETIGAFSYPVSYVVDEALYVGVYITCADYSACDNLLTTVKAAWGNCDAKEYASGSLPDCFFDVEQGAGEVGRVSGVWDYNQFNDKGCVMSIARDINNKARAIKDARAATAAEGL